MNTSADIATLRERLTEALTELHHLALGVIGEIAVVEPGFELALRYGRGARMRSIRKVVTWEQLLAARVNILLVVIEDMLREIDAVRRA